ncbi:hypothetical protein D3C77_344270 [compost metagenome]
MLLCCMAIMVEQVEMLPILGSAAVALQAVAGSGIPYPEVIQQRPFAERTEVAKCAYQQPRGWNLEQLCGQRWAIKGTHRHLVQGSCWVFVPG